MNIETLEKMLISLSRAGIDFYGEHNRLAPEEVSRLSFKTPFYEPQKHSHLELIWKLEGEPAIHINGNWTIYRDNKTKVFVPGACHSEHFLPLQSYKLLWLTVMPQSIMFHGTYYTPQRGYSTSLKRLSLNPPMVRKLWESASDPHLATAPVEQAEFHYLLMEALYFCIKNEEIFPSESTHFHQQVIEYLQHYLEDYYWDEITLDRLAEAVHYSPGHLNALFKKSTGEPLLQYLNKIRMNKARDLLSDGAMLVKQAAEAVGIHDPLYFSKKFRQHFGVSPQTVIGNSRRPAP